MLTRLVWQGLDRLSFCENAILLEAKARSQGTSIWAYSKEDHTGLPFNLNLTRQMVRNFLDDFALVAAGRGGKDNVCAACMEIRDEDQIITLRIAKNDGVDEQTLRGLEDLAQLMTKSTPTAEPEIHERKQEILLEILGRCAGRLLKHTQRFTNELRNAGCRPLDQYTMPRYILEGDQTETLEDVQRLGRHCQENHDAYMQTCRDRLNQLRDLASELSRSPGSSKPQKMMLLAELAYDVRRSSAFRQFLQHNLRLPRRSDAMVSIVGSIVERLGKISRFYRAAATLTAVGMKLLKKNVSLQVQGIPTSKFRITELNGRTAAQLRSRGGHEFASSSGVQLQAMINRWPQYRLHSEIQLVVFYHRNPDLLLQSTYIGCDKLSCYLCHSFITSHGQFEVKGCHQSLYSLWTVPDLVTFENEERADCFCNALKALCEDLESKMTALRDSQSKHWKYTTNNESFANLSRLSIPLTISRAEQDSLAQDMPKGLQDSQIRGAQAETVPASRNSLEMIPELSLLEDSPDKAESIQTEPLKPGPPVTEIHREASTIELDAARSDPILAGVISEYKSTRRKQRQRVVLRAKQASNHHQQRLPGNKRQTTRHIQDRRVEKKSSLHPAPKHEYLDGTSRYRRRRRTRPKHYLHSEWRDSQDPGREKDRLKRHYQPGVRSRRTLQSNPGILSRFWLFCAILARGCFGDSRKSL